MRPPCPCDPPCSRYDIDLRDDRELALRRLTSFCRAGFVSVTDFRWAASIGGCWGWVLLAGALLVGHVRLVTWIVVWGLLVDVSGCRWVCDEGGRRRSAGGQR